MFGIGPTELVVILVIGLLVLGPRRLPEMARSLGKGLAEFRRASSDLRQSLALEDEPRRYAPPASRPAQALPGDDAAPETSDDPAEGHSIQPPEAVPGESDEANESAESNRSTESAGSPAPAAPADPAASKPPRVGPATDSET